MRDGERWCHATTHSLLLTIEFLRLFVQRGALLDRDKTFDPQGLARLRHCRGPLAKALFLRLTIFPDLLLMRSVFFRPLAVLALVPRNTELFASLPFATTDFFIARRRMPFIAARIAFAMT